jgi:hypothetical protein
MVPRLIINTQGSLLSTKALKSPFFFSKQDPYSNFLWKSVKKRDFVRQTKILDTFKTRFVSK